MFATHLIALDSGAFLRALERCFRASFDMAYETFWALVLGFSLSGYIQANVSRDAMLRRLGDHRPASVVRASLYGMASSSCSYAASAIARSLVAKGADFLSAMVFMFASTNLVVELGIVLLVLLGWQFLLGEFVGGIVMIVLLVLLGATLLTRRSHYLGALVDVDSTDEGDRPKVDGASVSTRAPASSLRVLVDSARFAIADLAMLCRELLVGVVLAGVLASVVPTWLWSAVFIEGHGSMTVLENAAIAPLVAIVSCVCSVGNVPLAAALWHGGVSFAGVVSFVFADLVAFPLLLIYRRLYGGALALRLLGLFWVVMSLAGIATAGLFGAIGISPVTRPATIAPTRIGWDATTYLDIVFALVLLGAYLVHRAKDRLGASGDFAADPVCGMQVARAQAPAVADHEGATYWFCSLHCRDEFLANPARYLRARSPAT
jgi:uncharacterized protein